VCGVLNSEVSERLQEVNDVKAALVEAQSSLQKKEADIARIHKMVSGHMFGVLFRASTLHRYCLGYSVKEHLHCS
jgi:hypothetical protein